MSRPRHTDSYFAATARGAIEHPPLLGEVACDVCVIGGGFTGLSTALHLAERGFEVVLLEARRVGWGASGRNGGQLGSGQRQPQGELERLVGAAQARALWNLAEEAKAAVKQRIRRHDIPLRLDNYILATEPLGETGAREIIRDDVAVSETKFVIDYYRLSADRRLLFGGGETYRRGFPADIKGFVRKCMLRVYPPSFQARASTTPGAGRLRSR